VLITDHLRGMPVVKSLPAYYVLIVAGHGQAVPRDEEPIGRPTIAQRLRALIAGVRAGRPVHHGRPRPA
jgi:hypothetical protein